MNIKFKGHSPVDREVEITQKELFQLFEFMREQFKNHITYARFDHSYPDKLEMSIVQYCESHGIDVEYEKDRVAFFTSLLDALKNPYQ
jgi:hypothetical protein